ncbi:hypothetical protein EJB06_09750 [Massilia atriviolacea]|uniref:Uncharacterized protein n=2 Tax=Massilia atriviolacea TaxID=2495579 RepID=A0A430HPI8_9BURK|nr:hypothetical protein EJB06_09750 [Massilia atriviolacea]
MKQPDFNRLFFDTFKDCPAGIHYKVRSDSNFQHDIHFVYSLVKDASFTLGDITHEKQSLVIPLRRQRSEWHDGTAPPKLNDMNSELRFTRVKRIEWTASQIVYKAPFEGAFFDVDDTISASTRCDIDALFIGESTHAAKSAEVEIVIAGYPGGWRLRIGLAQEGWTVSVKDASPAIP